MIEPPLHSFHQQAGAEFQSYGDLTIVSTFGEPQAEYAAIHKSAGLMDMSHRGILELTGKDRLSFLNNLLTNQTWNKEAKVGMPAGSGVYAFFLNTKGRIVADMNVLELGNHTLLEMDARLVEPVRQAFEKYLFAEQVKITAQLGASSILLLSGPKAPDLLKQLVAIPLTLAPTQCAEADLFGTRVCIFRDDPCVASGFVLICPSDAVGAIWQRFTSASSPSAGDSSEPGSVEDLRFRGLARPIGWAAYNTARIEAGRPLFGIDFDDSVLPAETAQLSRAVSFTKGCYLGQEIVARMHARGQLAKQIVGVRMEGDALPIAPTKVYDQSDNEIGGITSSTLSPILSNAPLCLGLVKKPFIAEGTKLRIAAEGAIHLGTVSPLPFVKLPNP